jgi:hypothetical protein
MKALSPTRLFPRYLPIRVFILSSRLIIAANFFVSLTRRQPPIHRLEHRRVYPPSRKLISPPVQNVIFAAII